MLVEGSYLAEHLAEENALTERGKVCTQSGISYPFGYKSQKTPIRLEKTSTPGRSRMVENTDKI